MAKIGLVTWSLLALEIVMSSSMEQSVGWGWVGSRGLNKPSDLMDWLCGPAVTWLLALPQSPTAGVVTPTPKMTHTVRLKETLYFTGLILMAKQMHITTIIKNTILEKTARGGVDLQSCYGSVVAQVAA